VAQLAGLPGVVIERAKEILKTLENDDIRSDSSARILRETAESSPKAHKLPAEPEHHEPLQLSLFGSKGDDIVDELNAIDISNMTPLQALNKLQELKKKAGS
jgi:DNA mismatch repair protein MutS